MHRITATTISLLTVQFNKYGGSFAIELGRAPASDYAPWPGKDIPPTQLSARDLPFAQRARLVSAPGSAGDEWFSYRCPPSAGEDTGRFAKLARSAATLLDEMEAWWAGASPPHVQDFIRPLGGPAASGARARASPDGGLRGLFERWRRKDR